MPVLNAPEHQASVVVYVPLIVVMDLVTETLSGGVKATQTELVVHVFQVFSSSALMIDSRVVYR